MYGYIYLTTNKLNNLIYIGQRKSDKFQTDYRGSGIHLKRAVKKYGKDNFTTILIDEATSPKELDEKEIYWIKFYNSTDPSIGYNISKGGLVNRSMGGIHNPNYGKHWDDGWKKKQSKRMIARLHDHPENNPMYGKPAATRGTHWCTNGTDEMMAIECPDGWRRGRADKTKQKISIMTSVVEQKRDAHFYTNGQSCILIYGDMEIPEGYYPGGINRHKQKPNAASGKMWINNNIIEKYIDKNDDIPEGFLRGRLRRKRNT